MKLISSLFVCLILTNLAFSQNRQAAMDQFNELKKSAVALEKAVLAPSEADLAAAASENASAVRILPRETYDNSFSSIRGGGAYYSFYFRTHDWGHGTEIGREQGFISTGFSDFGVLADLGVVDLSTVDRDTKGVKPLSDYAKTKSADYYANDFAEARRDGLKLESLVYLQRTKPIVGNTYVLRSLRQDSYDVLIAFKILREDSDKSLILLWRMIEQFDTPKRGQAHTSQNSDAEILARLKEWQRDERLKDIQVGVSAGVVTLRGTVERKFWALPTQFANAAGASKVINLVAYR